MTDKIPQFHFRSLDFQLWIAPPGQKAFRPSRPYSALARDPHPHPHSGSHRRGSPAAGTRRGAAKAHLVRSIVSSSGTCAVGGARGPPVKERGQTIFEPIQPQHNHGQVPSQTHSILHNVRSNQELLSSAAAPLHPPFRQPNRHLPPLRTLRPVPHAHRCLQLCGILAPTSLGLLSQSICDPLGGRTRADRPRTGFGSSRRPRRCIYRRRGVSPCPVCLSHTCNTTVHSLYVIYDPSHESRHS